ncbi:MAG: SPOR domain-containing protein [Desulfosarcina sp.]|nr:SPOR domain-containing protein [Desulfobacterales bacterium]
MIHLLKNTAFRIWSAGLAALMVSLWLLPHTGEAVSIFKPLLIVGILFAAAFSGIGWLTDRIVRIQLRPLLHEAGILERGGMGLAAERAFENALALLDSFMVTPRHRRYYLRALGKRMARFYAAQAEKNDQAVKWITRYLRAYPGDGAIAEVWLQDMESRSGWTKSQQDLATRIGEARSDDRRVQAALARLYIRAHRTDFPALQTYRRIMEDPDWGLGPMVLDLARLFIKEGRADEWALRAYVHAAQRRAPSENLLCGLAACLRWIQTSERTRDLLTQARTLIGASGENDLERMSSGFFPPTTRFESGAEAARPLSVFHSGYIRVVHLTGDLGNWMGRGIQTATAGMTSTRLPTLLKVGLIVGLAIAAITLLFNTAGHLVRPPSPPPPPPPKVAVKIEPTPYTLQVAAYLKPEHAERYVQGLQGKGLDAYRIEAQGHQKTWYQVRVGHFPTKAAARSHGRELKAAGVIEDFYVANYQGS